MRRAEARLKKRGRTRLTSGVFARALNQGDELATALVERAIEALGAGIALAVNLLDGKAVIIGGELGVRLGPPTPSASSERCCLICPPTTARPR